MKWNSFTPTTSHDFYSKDFFFSPNFYISQLTTKMHPIEPSRNMIKTSFIFFTKNIFRWKNIGLSNKEKELTSLSKSRLHAQHFSQKKNCCWLRFFFVFFSSSSLLYLIEMPSAKCQAISIHTVHIQHRRFVFNKTFHFLHLNIIHSTNTNNNINALKYRSSITKMDKFTHILIL